VLTRDVASVLTVYRLAYKIDSGTPTIATAGLYSGWAKSLFYGFDHFEVSDCLDLQKQIQTLKLACKLV
jgi:hypothetical protein